jgi:WXG100 family type VII secretion target
MSDGNANGLSQAEQALSRAADFVDTARGDVTKQCQNLGDQMGVLAGQWGGQGAMAFNKLMMAWQDKQRVILDALGDLSRSLQETEKDNVATDSSQAESVSRLQGRLG